jgi:hypothetical protein
MSRSADEPSGRDRLGTGRLRHVRGSLEALLAFCAFAFTFSSVRWMIVGVLICSVVSLPLALQSINLERTSGIHFWTVARVCGMNVDSHATTRFARWGFAAFLGAIGLVVHLRGRNVAVVAVAAVYLSGLMHVETRSYRASIPHDRR